MYDKYKEITIFEIENGYILKTTNATNPKNINDPQYESIYYPDKEKLTKGIMERL